MPIISSFPHGGGTSGSGGGGSSGSSSLGPVSAVNVLCASGKVYVKWTDPADAMVDEQVAATWGGTVLVRKAGSFPADQRDGTIVVDSKQRNQYQNAYFCDSGLADGTKYYYKLFPYTSAGTYTSHADGEFTATPTKQVVGIDDWNTSNLTAAPAGDGKISVQWTDPAATIVSDGVTLATWAATTVVVKEGAYPTGKDDPAAAKTVRVTARNQHILSPLVIPDLKNETTYYVQLFPETTDGGVNTSPVNRVLGNPSRVVISKIPKQSGKLTYNHSAQIPEWSDYNPSTLTLGGTTVGTDAGTYEATFTPAVDACWEDGTSAAKIVQWSIEKATGTMSVAPTEVILNNKAPSVIVKVTGDYDGTVSATPKDSSLVSALVAGADITLSNVDESSGKTTVTVSCSEGKNYTAPSDQVVSVTASFVAQNVYGVSWAGTSDSAMTRTDAAADFIDPTPAVNNGTGSSPFDNIMPWSGMKRVTDAEAGELVEIPKYWYKWSKSGKTLNLQISNVARPGFFVSPAHADRGDGKGERNVVYVGRYHCANSWKSETGVTPHAFFTRSMARTYIHSCGDTVWQWDWAMNWTIRMWYIVEFAHWNSQEKIGYGCGDHGAPKNMGYTDNMQHHTGTVQASREAYGLGTQYRYIEGLWDNIYDWVDGCYYNSNGLNIIANPNKFSDNSDGVLVGLPASGYPSQLEIAEKNGAQWVYPVTADGSETTYIPDAWHFNASYPCLRTGGYTKGLTSGMFFITCNEISNSLGVIGTRLMKLP